MLLSRPSYRSTHFIEANLHEAKPRDSSTEKEDHCTRQKTNEKHDEDTKLFVLEGDHFVPVDLNKRRRTPTEVNFL